MQNCSNKFKPRVKEPGKYISIFDISFEGGQIDVDETVEEIFHNISLVYTYFMHLLINSEEDVNQLCRCNIFEFKSVHDEGVALMLNKFGEGRILNKSRFFLSK
ncbi:unnamed protein product [Camellia sinensis]